jgi:hypothetical protein
MPRALFPWLLLLLVLVLHQLTAPWGNERLWFGFLPHVLAYHLMISLLAAGAWALLVKFSWPRDLADTEADSPEERSA